MNRKKLIKIGIPAVFYSLLIIFFVLYLRSIDFTKLSHVSLNWIYLIISVVAGLVFRYWGAYIWIVILRGLGAKDITLSKELGYVYAKAWLGRYIPGTAPWILGKIYFASQHGISKNKLAVSSLLEGALQIVVMLVLSFGILLFDPRLDILGKDFKFLMGAVLIACIVCLIPKIFNFFVSLAYRILRRQKIEAEHLATTGVIVKGSLLYAIGAVVNAISLFYIAKAVYAPLPYNEIVFVMGVGTLASAASMLAIFAPSGIGVREGIQLALLSLIMPPEQALVVTIFTRLISIVTDLLFFGVAGIAHRAPDRSLPW